MSIIDLCLEVEGLLGRLREEDVVPEEKEKLLVAIDAIRFIAASGQSYDFEDYRKSLDANAPPLAIAAFDTIDAAQAWLEAHPRPPVGACVLVSGAYQRVFSSKDGRFRELRPSPGTLEYYLEDLTRDGLPAPVATFGTREEAVAWLDSQSESPGHAFIVIAGDCHVAVYHHRIKLWAIHRVPTQPPRKPPEPA